MEAGILWSAVSSSLRKLLEGGRVSGVAELNACGVRFVRFDLGAVSAPEVLVQHAIKVRLLRVNVYGRRLVHVQAVGFSA